MAATGRHGSSVQASITTLAVTPLAAQEGGEFKLSVNCSPTHCQSRWHWHWHRDGHRRGADATSTVTSRPGARVGGNWYCSEVEVLLGQ
jgi:hypothetical protein